MVRVTRRKNPAAPTEVHPLAMLRDLNVRMEWDEETESWVTFVPELNNISTFGRTQEEALDATTELVRGYLDSMQERRLRIPLSAAAIRRVREALA
ncbi:MAG: type II toxin-antitoxin system HicB family antitoxin [Acidobacteriia bacterium]|nr:type II toxin-antitoxin system HicB family antitoxin [Terriglobia bacterium]